MDEEKALIAHTGTLKTFDGGKKNTDLRVRINMEFEGENGLKAMQYFGIPGIQVAIVALEKEATILYQQNKTIKMMKGEYGAQAKILKQSSFFRTPAVWKKIGTDDDFKSWIRTQPCAACGKESTDEFPTQAAHVRGIENGAGMGIKPEYNTIPLCHECHINKQHHKGKSSLNIDMNKVLIDMLSTWCWVTLKKHLGKESWTEIEPHILKAWAECHDVLKHLPKDYYEEEN